MGISAAQLSAIAGIPLTIILLAWLTVIFFPTRRTGQFFREHQQLTTGTATALLAILTVLAVLDANQIDSEENRRKRSVGAYVISGALKDLETSASIAARFGLTFKEHKPEQKNETKWSFKFDDIKMPETLSDFQILQTQTAKTLARLSNIRVSVFELNTAIAFRRIEATKLSITMMYPPPPNDEEFEKLIKDLEGEIFAVRCELAEITGEKVNPAAKGQHDAHTSALSCEDAISRYLQPWGST